MIRHKFLIGNVLKKVTTKKLPFKAKTLPKTTNGDKSLVPLMAAGVENQGCVGYVKPNEPTVLHSLITVSANGANSGATFYQQRKFSILQDAYALELVDKYADYASDDVYLYLTAVVDHRLKDNGYNNKATWNRIKNYYIELPVTPAGDPDFEHMTMRIRELEAERIRELEAYLRVTGLDDTTLSVSEAQALTQDVKWKKFRIGDVFDIHPSARKINANVVKFNGHYPYVARGTSTNGIRGYIDWDITDLNSANTISFGQDTATIYYQDKPYFTGDKIQIFELKDRFPKLNSETAQFMIACMNAVFGNYTWGQQSFAVKKLREAEFMLPVTFDNDIDFDYMQNYIRATEKQTIKGVVEYKDRVIAETKKVVGAE